MSYTPTTWATGDTITASAMNKIENGIANAGGGGVSGYTIESGVLNGSYNDLKADVIAGKTVYASAPDNYDESYLFLVRLCYDGDTYYANLGDVALIQSSPTGNMFMD